MQFLVICRDAEDGQEKRTTHLKAHLDYIETILEHIEVAGPLADADSGEHRDSCFIYRADSEEEALQLLLNDPYCKGGVYQDWQIREFRGVAGRWVGGKNW